MADNTLSQNSELRVTENIKIWIVKMCTGFLQIMIRSGCGFGKLGKEALSSTAGTQMRYFRMTQRVVFLE